MKPHSRTHIACRTHCGHSGHQIARKASAPGRWHIPHLASPLLPQRVAPHGVTYAIITQPTFIHNLDPNQGADL
jgi:hypothetical protein